MTKPNRVKLLNQRKGNGRKRGLITARSLRRTAAKLITKGKGTSRRP